MNLTCDELLRRYAAGQRDFCGADLRYADLREADLRYADLRYADLRYADLREADLSGANLSGANLSGANLRGADLSGANLREANLSGAKLSVPVCRMDFGDWSVCIFDGATSIGCQRHPHEKWLEWSPESPEIAAMNRGAPEWWKVHGDAVKAVIRCVSAKHAAKGGVE